MTRTTVADLGEDDLLARIFPLLPTGSSTVLGPGDDAAVLATPDGRVVVSTDVLVEGHHFRRDWSTGRDVGHRAAVQNLADVAAMGADPTALVVGLVVPAALEVDWVLDLARGLADGCAGTGAGVVGGDLSAGEQVVVAVTVHGDLQGGEPVRRSGARPGDVVAHAGVRGRSVAGLELLRSGVAAPSGRQLALIDAYRRPVAPVGAGPAARRAGATAMLDVSDGLLRDAGRLARASDVVVALEDPRVVFADDVAVLAPVAAELGADPVDWVLTGGEDHGLLATFPAGTPLPEGFRAVGLVEGRDGAGAAAGDAGAGVLVAGRPWAGATGWDHFRA